MTFCRFTESVVEDAALAWLAASGTLSHGPEIAPGEIFAERRDPGYRDVVLERRLRDALARLNPELPAEALEDAFRKLTRPDAPSLVERNRAVHRMLVDGVTVEYRRPDGSIAGAQARVIDFDDPDNNDWLAVNQFTVVEGKHTRRPGRRALRQRPAARGDRAEERRPTRTPRSGPPSTSSRPTRRRSRRSSPSTRVLVVSDGVAGAHRRARRRARSGSSPGARSRASDCADADLPELQVVLEGVFEQRRFLDLVRHFIVFEDDGGGELAKKMAGYHQFHAVQRGGGGDAARGRAAPRRDRVAENQGRYEAGTHRAASRATGGSAWSGTRRARARA